LFATYLIGLREVLAATLLVSILVAFLVRAERSDRLVPLWAGVGLAIALSAGVGWLLSYTSSTLLATYEHRELFEAVTSVLAVVFVTWMIFWMRSAARSVAGDPRSRLGAALAVGPAAVAALAFLAVAREGLETSLIFYSAVQGASTSAGPLYALLGGIATAIGIGRLLYAGAVRFDLSRFFAWTGALLVLVAAGILKYGVHDFQEAGVLPGLHDLAFDISGVLDPESWYGALLAGMFTITPAPSVLEVAAWAAYGVPVLVLFLRPTRRRPAAAGTTPHTTPAPAPQQ
jgi:high-affinity iron transporter